MTTVKMKSFSQFPLLNYFFHNFTIIIERIDKSVFINIHQPNGSIQGGDLFYVFIKPIDRIFSWEVMSRAMRWVLIYIASLLIPGINYTFQKNFILNNRLKRIHLLCLFELPRRSNMRCFRAGHSNGNRMFAASQ